jgi:hypothetical protein
MSKMQEMLIEMFKWCTEGILVNKATRRGWGEVSGANPGGNLDKEEVGLKTAHTRGGSGRGLQGRQAISLSISSLLVNVYVLAAGSRIHRA